MSFNKRKNICLATGSLIQLKEFSDSNKQYSDFLKFHPDGILHPLRATIIKNKKSLIQYIDSYMANFWEKKRKEWEEKSSFFTKWKNRIYNAAFASKRSYLKFNIVEKYNEYKMFVIPEEAIDLPGIGYVEGMACGTAYIGKIDPMYTDLGLIPGKHFIGYNGTLADLKKKINYYQKNNDKLEVIANSGYKFVSENFSEDTVAGRFWNDLETLNRKYEIKNSKNQLVFKSGFNKSIL
jgi:glycosyltransferase involved in cell wall biosynthesis